MAGATHAPKGCASQGCSSESSAKLPGQLTGWELHSRLPGLLSRAHRACLFYILYSCLLSAKGPEQLSFLSSYFPLPQAPPHSLSGTVINMQRMAPLLQGLRSVLVSWLLFLPFLLRLPPFFPSFLTTLSSSAFPLSFSPITALPLSYSPPMSSFLSSPSCLSFNTPFRLASFYRALAPLSPQWRLHTPLQPLPLVVSCNQHAPSSLCERHPHTHQSLCRQSRL